MLRRTIHSLGPEISQLTFGTMRLTELVDDLSASEFLCWLHDQGVDTHHSSCEYDSHPVYLAALASASRTGRTFQHIVKLSCPGFDAERFDASRLTRDIDRELRELATDQLASVQWLVRTPDASNHPAQVAVLTDQSAEIDHALGALVASGKVASFVSFPYSVAAAEAAVALREVHALCVYLNLVETDFVPFLEDTSALAIRPLAAGRLVRDPIGSGLNATFAEGSDLFEISLQFPLLHPNVATIITSLRTTSQAESSLRAVRETVPNVAEFDRIRLAATAITVS